MKCPHCSLVLEGRVIAQFVDALTYKKYKIFLSDKQMMKNPDLRWCPNPRCGKVVNIKQKSGKTAKCVCGTEICVKCNREGHGKLTCKEVFDKETKEWEDVTHKTLRSSTFRTARSATRWSRRCRAATT